MTVDLVKTKPYPHEYFVTVTGVFSQEKITRPFPDELTALQYTRNMRNDPHFMLASESFDWHVTFYVTSKDAEMSAKFNETSGAEEFIETAGKDHDLVVLEYNFVSFT